MKLADQLAKIVREAEIEADPFEDMARFIEERYVLRSDSTDESEQGRGQKRCPPEGGNSA